MREWLTRLFDWFRRDTLERELREELEFHRRLANEDADVLAAEESRRRRNSAARALEGARERWSVPWLDHFQHDLRYAVRGLRRSPSFTLTVFLTLSLGIGANAAMFDVVDRLMFRPLEYLRDPATVHRVYMQWNARGSVTTSTWVSFQRYQHLREWTQSFSHTAVFAEGTRVIGVGEAARERRVAAVTASYFDLFDARPVAGRFFNEAEDRAPRGAAVAVVARSFWETELGGRDVLGESLHIGNLQMTIIGVAPAGFSGLTDGQPAAIFIPLTTLGHVIGGAQADTFSSGYLSLWGQMLVRRRPGVTREAASADVNQAFVRSWEAERAIPVRLPLEPTSTAAPRALVSAVRTGAGPDPALEARTSLWVAAVAMFVLIIAAANVANLMLGRALTQQHETAVRLALGITRMRLLTQTLAQSLVLACLGTAGGLLIATWAGSAMFGLLFPPGATPPDASIGIRTIVVTLATSLGIGLLTGLGPFFSMRRAPSTALKSGGRGATPQSARLRSALVLTQAALSVVLLIGAALFVRSLDAVKTMRMGYEPDRVLVVNRVLRGVTLDRAGRIALRRQLLQAAQALPGVEAATWRSTTPLGTVGRVPFFVAGIESVERLGFFNLQEASPDYFKVMGTRLLRGRPFSNDDRAGTPGVVIVSESMAAVLWPGQDAIGRCMRFGTATAPCATVVGVTEDAVDQSVTATRHQFYLPIEQSNGDGSGMLLRVQDPVASAEPIRLALQRMMPGTSYIAVQPMQNLVARSQRSWQLGATMFVAFGALALIVAGIGLYGVIGNNISQRLHEIAVRVALGARRRDVLRLVVTPGIRVAAGGAVIGMVAALTAARWLQPLLFGQSARDPIVYAGAAVAMVIVALAASIGPTARALRADPTRVLQAE